MRVTESTYRKKAWIYMGSLLVLFFICGIAFASGGGGEAGAAHHDEGAKMLDLLYRTMNFALLVIILFVVIKKTSIKDFFANRREEIRNSFEMLNREKAAAEGRDRELEKKLKEFEAARTEIIEQYKAEGAQEKERIIAEARNRAKQMLEQAELTIQQEIQAARDRLKREALDIATIQARDILQKEMKASDQDHLVDEFITGIQKLEKLH